MTSCYSIPRSMRDLRQMIYRSFWAKKLRPFSLLPLHGVGAEIGVSKGDFSRVLLKKSGVVKLFLVEPFLWNDAKKAMKATFKLMSGYQDRKDWVVATSFDAVELLPPLDFAYLDGDHSYETVKRELELYWPKINDGGFLGGHDFDHDGDGVVRAVTEFSVKNNLKLKVSSPDWWIQK